jgi:hypothetical protein
MRSTPSLYGVSQMRESRENTKKQYQLLEGVEFLKDSLFVILHKRTARVCFTLLLFLFALELKMRRATSGLAVLMLGMLLL